MRADPILISYTMAKEQLKNYTQTVGRRRSAVARVRLFKGGKESLVNEKPVREYFPASALAWQKPFVLTNTLGKYFFTVKVSGGGKMGQLDAVVLGVARAFSKLDGERFRAPLKKAGLLSRDARVRERRKVGTGGRARRKKQSPKR